jgi:lipopolysaccharide/colanic/teichoic acid biosynthesis glycosyltransferase
VNECPGALAKIYVAYGYFRASKSIDDIVRSSSSPAVTDRFDGWFRVRDIGVAIVLLALVFPVLAIATLCIKLESPGPLFSRRNCIGQGGRVFQLLRFRCADSGSGDQITWVGSILRRTHWNELPILFNVLRGDMSFVGPKPKPKPPYSVGDGIHKEIEGYTDLKPGITGWAQIKLFRDTTNTGNKLERDRSYNEYYAKHRSLRFGLRITFSTLILGLFDRGKK